MLVQARAKAAGKEIEVKSIVCAGAFEAVTAGDTAKHDALVAAGLRDLSAQCDVIVLAQASMARLLEAPSFKLEVPVLASPELGLRAVQAKLRERGIAVD